MHVIGVIRRIDDLGRIVLPKEFRDALGLKGGTPMQIFCEDGGAYLKKHEPEKSLEEKIDSLDETVSEMITDLGVKKTDDIRKCIKELKSLL